MKKAKRRARVTGAALWVALAASVVAGKCPNVGDSEPGATSGAGPSPDAQPATGGEVDRIG